MINNNFVTIIGKIKEVKALKGITNATLSKQSGVPLGTLIKILAGGVQSVKAETLSKITASLGISLNDLYQQDNANNFASDNYGYIKVASYTPNIKVGDVKYNVSKILSAIDEAYAKNVKVLVFPELCITGATCGDLFFQEALLDGALNGLKTIKDYSLNKNMLIFVGLPIRVSGKLYNVGACVCNGEILGMSPKTYTLSNLNDDLRYFTFDDYAEIELVGEEVIISDSLIYESEDIKGFTVGAEIGVDMFAPVTQSAYHASNGANIVVNLSAQYEVIGKNEKIQNAIKNISLVNSIGYVYANAGFGESTADVVYAGGNYIVENGSVLASSKTFTNGITVSDIDVSYLEFIKSKNSATKRSDNYIFTKFKVDLGVSSLDRKYSKTPFVPETNIELKERAEYVLTLQAHGLYKRIKHVNPKTLVLGVSGGLDSTLALLVCKRAMDLAGRDSKDILAVTMPCFGTTARTKNNAIKMSNALGVTLKEINISNAVRVHFNDIGHDESVTDVTYENSQARERTQVLMDLANKTGGLVIGTGDLSEIALGWATYNGDHMSMYSVNAGVPKTLIRYLVGYEAQRLGKTVKDVLNDVLDTPVSPELIPPSGDDIKQKTEDIVGPYLLHDFYIYYAINKGFKPSKIYYVAKQTFNDLYSNEVLYKWLLNFYNRFFTQQFKRNCVPDGIKVGSLSFSPRGDFKMPSDAMRALWLADLERVKQ